MLYSTEEYCIMYIIYGDCGRNSRLAAQQYAEMFGGLGQRLPSHSTFTRLDQRIRETGSVAPCRRERGDNNQQRNLQRENRVLEMVRQNPRSSVRQIGRQLELPKSVVHQLTKKNRLKPYHYRKVQFLEPEDHPSRRRFSRWILKNQEKIPLILWTDESLFTREGMFNVHHSHWYAEENPYVYRQGKMQRRFKLNVWAGLVGDQVIGPYLLQETLNVSINFYLRTIMINKECGEYKMRIILK